jgi:O-antigen/teichoic acid export membrane protein
MGRPDHSDELKSVVKGAGVTFVGKIVGGGLQYLYHIVIARFLGAELLGLYLLGLTVTNIAGVVAKLGLDKGILRFVPLYQGEGDLARVKGTLIDSLKVAVTVSFAIAGLLFFLSAPLAERVFQKPELTGILRILSLSLPFYVPLILTLCGIQAFQVMRFNVYVQNLFQPLTALALTVLLFLLGFQLAGVIAAYMISLIGALILSSYFLVRVFPAIKKEAIAPVYERKKLLRYSFPLILVMFLNFSLLWTDVLMLGHYRTSNEVGIYGVAVKTALLTILVLVAFNSIFTPMMSDLFNRGETAKVGSLFKTLTRWIFLASFPYFLLTVLLAKEIMGFFGAEFVTGWSCLIVLVFSQLVNATTGSVFEILTMSGKQTITLYNEIFAVLLNVILNAVLIPPFGMIGAAVATGIALTALNLIGLVQVHRFHHIHPYSPEFLKPLTAGVLSFSVLFFIKDWLSFYYGLLTLLAVSGLFLLIYLFLLLLMGLSKDDRFILERVRSRLFSNASEPVPYP